MDVSPGRGSRGDASQLKRAAATKQTSHPVSASGAAGNLRSAPGPRTG